MSSAASPRRRLSPAARIAIAFALLATAATMGLTGTTPSAQAAPMAPAAPTQSRPMVTGAGASFPNLEIAQWRADVARPPYNLQINYNPAGSTFGRDQYRIGLVDFGQSDIPYPPYELPALNATARKDFVYVPVSAGAIGFLFNVVGANGQQITDLKLTQPTVCRMFTEPGMTWNDPDIVASNPGIPLPAEQIRPVVRSDSSGTSYVLSEYCIATAPDVWRAFIGRVQATGTTADDEFMAGRPSSSWPQLGGLVVGFASEGVVGIVANKTAGRSTISYLEAGYSVKVGLPVAKVRNGSGQFTPPLPANSTVALGYAIPQANGTFLLRYNGPDPRAYFPSTYSYTIAQTKGFDPAKGAVLSTYLYYAVTKGQERAEPLLYSRLSSVLVNLALDKISQIPGAGPRPTDLAGAPPPPQVLGGSPVAVAAGAAKGVGGATTSGGGPAGGANAAPGADGAVDPAAAAAAAAAAPEGEAVATDQGYDLGLSDADVKDLAEKVGSTMAASTTTGPDLGEVATYLLIGFLLVGAGSFLASGVKTSWQRR
ncbi:MAG TPA: substrate-binding domain-containing protein [Microthrixaceae bacterium]|jgi:phosphate transport system substrate-binding protein|nr:substrate-binding domain-containing protein [Microthrixaceae bacterium]